MAVFLFTRLGVTGYELILFRLIRNQTIFEIRYLEMSKHNYSRITTTFIRHSTCSASAGSGVTPPKSFEIVHSKSYNLVHFGGKVVRSQSVNNVFVNTSTVGTPFRCVPATFQQSEHRSNTFSFETTPVGNTSHHLRRCCVFF